MGTCVWVHTGLSAKFPRAKAACPLPGCCKSPGVAREEIQDLGALQVTRGKVYGWDMRRACAVPGSCFLAGMSELLAGGAWEHMAGGKFTSAKNLEHARVKQLGLAL